MSDWNYECMLHDWASFHKPCPDCHATSMLFKAELDYVHETQMKEVKEVDTLQSALIDNRILLDRIAYAERVIAFYANKDSWRNAKGHVIRSDAKALTIVRSDSEPEGYGMIGGKLAREYINEKN